MPRPKGSGLNVARKRRPDGTTVEYFYDRATGKALGHDREAALLLVTPEEPPVTADPNSIAALITMWLARPEFTTSLAPRTQRLYRGYLDEIRREYGPLPFRSFGPVAIENIKADYADQPRKCNQILALFRILLGYAVKLRLMRENTASRPGMLATKPRTEIWTPVEIRTFCDGAHPRLKLAMMLLLYTAQRPGDVLAMTRGAVRDAGGRLYIRLRQQKTGALVEVPVHTDLAPLLRDRLTNLAEGMLLVPSPTGRPWAYRNFARAWDAQAKAAGVADRQRRDMRRTAVVRLAEAGATVPQIAAVTGWAVDYCQRIVDTYLPQRTETALIAIELWEGAPEPQSKVVGIGLGRKGARINADQS